MLELYFEKRGSVTGMKPGAMEKTGIQVQGPVLQGKMSVQDALLRASQEAELLRRKAEFKDVSNLKPGAQRIGT